MTRRNSSASTKAAAPELPAQAVEAKPAKPESEAERHIDWDLLDDERVAEVHEQVARKVGNEYSDVTTVEDQHQEAAVLLATNPYTVQAYLNDELMGPRALYRWLHSRLVDAARPQAARSNRNVPLANLEVDAQGE